VVARDEFDNSGCHEASSGDGVGRGGQANTSGPTPVFHDAAR
jgi:hypothetical protein